MPGRIMEDGIMNGSQTNYDRERLSNGVNGTSTGTSINAEKMKVRSEAGVVMANSVEKIIPNGGSDDVLRDATIQQQSAIEEAPRDMISQLPPELRHISAGYLPLSRLLTRVAEHTHHAMETTIQDLARLPLPSSAINGNAAHLSNAGDDISHENINKKKRLLDFAQDTHTKFTKALVLTQWSQKSEDVSKVIDLRVHLMDQTTLFNHSFQKLADLKRDLGYMKVRSPDLESAVETISTGKCSRVPNHDYIEPPPLTPKETLKILKNLNTLLSLRMNNQEYERLPFHFKNFTIKSGRVTFHVAGEFELDVTIADEDPQTQFWFIDFRFTFRPSMSKVPEALLHHIQNRCDIILAQDDPLNGCYKFLHELVLTHKIDEIKRQAYELNQGKWVGTLIIEPLQRALCIQYWHGRYAGVEKGPRSWIIIGVNSGKRKDGRFDAKATPRIVFRWFRDAKEVKDIEIPVDLDRISTEALLKTVIGLHVAYILTSTHEKLKDVPLYKNRDLALQLSISPTEPIESTIKLQATHNETLTVAIEPITGRITVSPASQFSKQAEWTLNTKMSDPVDKMHELLMSFRPILVIQEIVRKCVSTGWENATNPGVKMSDLQSSIFRKDTRHMHWFRDPGWTPHWYVVVGISTSGEEWKLIETSGLKRPPPTTAKGRAALDISTAKVSRHLSMPMGVSPIPSYAFFGTLHIYAAAQISHLIDVATLHAAGVKYTLQDNMASVNNTSVKVPRIGIHLLDLARASGNSPSSPSQRNEGEKSLWAKDMVSFAFAGIEPSVMRKAIEPSQNTQNTLPRLSSNSGTPTVNTGPGTPSIIPGSHTGENSPVVNLINHASIIVPSCKDLELLGAHVDDDIGFHSPTGTFTIKIGMPFGQSSIPALQARLRDVERLVESVKVMDHEKSKFPCEGIYINKIVFTYTSDVSVTGEKVAVVKAAETGKKSLTFRATVNNVGSTPNDMATIGFEAGNPHIRMEDVLNRVLRKSGLNMLLSTLSTTLALLTAYDTIERSWLELADKATVFFGVRGTEKTQLIYRFMEPAKAGSPKFVRIEVELRKRNNLQMWLVKRVRDAGDVRSPDEVDQLLKSEIWGKLGTDPQKPWKGLDSGATAEVSVVGNLILAIDKILKSYATQRGGQEAEKGKEQESKVVGVRQQMVNMRGGPGPGLGFGMVQQQQQPLLHGVRPHIGQQQQQQQRGVAPQAPMMTTNPDPNAKFERIRNMPKAERDALLAKYQTQSSQARQQPPQPQQSQAAARQPRQGQAHEVITLDD